MVFNGSRQILDLALQNREFGILPPMIDHPKLKELIRAIPKSAWHRSPNRQVLYHEGKEIAVRPLFGGRKLFVAIRGKGGEDEWFTWDRSEVNQ
jgi:hypothetical protein